MDAYGDEKRFLSFLVFRSFLCRKCSGTNGFRMSTLATMIQVQSSIES
jgi:hypothetical protein